MDDVIRDLRLALVYLEGASYGRAVEWMNLELHALTAQGAGCRRFASRLFQGSRRSMSITIATSSRSVS